MTTNTIIDTVKEVPNIEEPHPADALSAHLESTIPSSAKRKSIIASIEAFIKHVISDVESKTETNRE